MEIVKTSEKNTGQQKIERCPYETRLFAQTVLLCHQVNRDNP